MHGELMYIKCNFRGLQLFSNWSIFIEYYEQVQQHRWIKLHNIVNRIIAIIQELIDIDIFIRKLRCFLAAKEVIRQLMI